ncbi:MAG: hypothetical protein V4581_05120, partial [Bacteroidota bacterium]
FTDFFEKFKKDSVYQIRHTEFPLFYVYSDEDFPLDDMQGMINLSEYRYNDFRKDTLEYKGKKYPNEVITQRSKDSVHYYQSGINSYVDLRYHFAFKDGCWYLVRFDDMTD